MTENITTLNCNAMIDEGGGGDGDGNGMAGNIDRRNPLTNNNYYDYNKLNCDKNSTKQSAADKILIHMSLGFREICIVTAALPLVTLFVCFITAYVFQSEEVHETHCRVYNIIPSISAITGVSPQRYFWRICIALHIGPRFMIAACYRRYYETLLKQRINRLIDELKYKKSYLLLRIVFVLHLIEISALCGVTYVSNRENYPIHEKIFIIFMTCSLCHMLATIKLWEMLQSPASSSPSPSSSNGETEIYCPEISDLERYSLKLKKSLFYLSIASTIALIIFFLKHRLLCHDMAFSWFALSEYVIATANMLFHCTTMLDFPNERMIILNIDGNNGKQTNNIIKSTASSSNSNNSNNNNNNNSNNENTKKIS